MAAYISKIACKNSKDFYIVPYYVGTLKPSREIKQLAIQDLYIEIKDRKRKTVFEELTKRAKRKILAHYLTKYGNFVCGEGMILLEDADYNLHQILVVYHLINHTNKQSTKIERFMMAKIPTLSEHIRSYVNVWHSDTIVTVVKNNIGLPTSYNVRKVPKEGKALITYLKNTLSTYTLIPNLIKNA